MDSSRRRLFREQVFPLVDGEEIVMVFSQIWSDGPMRCGRVGCPSWVQDRSQALFIVSGTATIPFCCPACFALACQRLLALRERDPGADPLARLGYVDALEEG